MVITTYVYQKANAKKIKVSFLDFVECPRQTCKRYNELRALVRCLWRASLPREAVVKVYRKR